MIASVVDGLGLTDVILILGATGIVATRVAEARGWFKGSSTLRRENEDLVRRNSELENAVSRYERMVDELRMKVNELEVRVAELSARDQAAVLRSIETHEENAGKRAGDQITLLTEIRDYLKERQAA